MNIERWVGMGLSSLEGELIDAARMGYPDKVEAALSSGVSPDVACNEGWTPLMWAVTRVDWVESEKGDKNACVRLLLAAGADVEKRDTDGWGALHLAAKTGMVSPLLSLLAGGADMEARTDEGHTPLHKAVQGGCPEVMEALLAAGADPNARGNEGETPLMMLWDADLEDMGGQTDGLMVEMVGILMAWGADAGLTNGNGRDAMMLASMMGASRAAKALAVVSDLGGRWSGGVWETAEGLARKLHPDSGLGEWISGFARARMESESLAGMTRGVGTSRMGKL